MAVHQSDTDYLYRLARSTKTEDRETLAKSISGLLQVDLTKGEMTLVQDILLRMLREAESELRRTLALYLSAVEKCPQSLIDYLFFECSHADCEPMLKNSAFLSDSFLIDVGRRFEDPKYWRTMAERKQIGRDLSWYLINTKDVETQKTLLGNQGAELCNQCLKLLTDLVINISDLQEPLLHRSEVTNDMAAKIYWHASEKIKQDIKQRFDIDQKTLDQAMHYVVDKRTTQRGSVRTISMEMLGLVRKMPRITTRQILEALQGGDKALFACLCGVHLKVNPEDVLTHLESNVMHTMTVLCRALNMTRTEFNNAYVMWRRGSGHSSVIGGHEMLEANKMFDAMKREDARAVIQEWIEL